MQLALKDIDLKTNWIKSGKESFLYYEKVDSTLNIALDVHHQEQSVGRIVITDNQVSGKGTYNKSWYSEPCKDEEGVVRGFLLEKGMEGFTSSDIHGKMSLRASITSELFMKDVRVPDKNRLPGVEGLKGPLSCLTQARYSIVWGTIGAAIDCYEVALAYSKDRKQFSKPIAGFQLTQQKLVEMVQEITKAQLLAIQLGKLKDDNLLDFSHISIGKKNNVAIARDCAKSAREILGANGIMDDYSVMRHMMNLETVYTYEGTHEIHTLIIGQKITDLSAFE